MSSSQPQQAGPCKALVTGGGGFLGRAVLRSLMDRGWQVASLNRRDYPELKARGVEVFQGDLADPRLVHRACQGRDVVFHVAAKAGVWGSYASYYWPNVEGTRNIIAACRAHGVSRLVFTSSPSVVFNGTDMEGIDESFPYSRRHRFHYSATKAEAERMVLSASGNGLKTVALRPHLIWGPGDNHIIPRIIKRARAGTLRIVGKGNNKVDTIYVDNAAEAHVKAADALIHNTERVAGRAFFIGQDEPIALWEIINRILEAAGVSRITRKLPRSVAWAGGACLEGAYKILRLPGEPLMTRFLAEELSTCHWFDIRAARRELDYQPTVSVEEGLQRLREWFVQEGYTTSVNSK